MESHFKHKASFNMEIEYDYEKEGDSFCVHIPLVDCFFSCKNEDEIQDRAQFMIRAFCDFHLKDCKLVIKK